MADSLNEILNKSTPPKPKPEEDEEDVGRCAAIAKNRWVTALTIKYANKPWESYQYGGIATRSVYEPTRFEVRFVDEDVTWKVTVAGRNLERIYMLVLQGRMEWVREAERDFARDGEPIILTITTQKVEEAKS